MSKTLASTNWNNTYPDMPTWIQDLVSEDEETRIDIWWTFDHFGLNTLSSFSPLLARILVELAQDDTIVYKEDLLYLLAEITYSAKQLNDEKKELALEVIQIIIKANADYLKIIRLNQNGWKEALKILSGASHYVYDVIPDLIDIVEHSQEIDKRIAYYETLSWLIEWDSDNKQTYIRYLVKNLDDEKNLPVRHSIALALLHLQGKAISSDVVELLKDFFRNKIMYAYLLQDILSLDIPLAVDIITNSFQNSTLYIGDLFHRSATLLSLVFDDGEMNVNELHGGHSGLKEHHFSKGAAIRKNKPIKPITRLNDIQKQALTAILQLKELWGIKTNLYGLYGLPDTLEEIEKLVLLQS